MVEDLEVRYVGSAAPAVAGFSLALPAGAAAVLSTASGTGKTSILRAVAGQLGPDRMDAASRATVAGTVRRRPGSRTAWIPQHPAFSEATVGEELALYAAACGAPHTAGGAGETAAAIASALERVNGAHLAQARIADCSPGELRRAAVARALVVVATDPAVDLLLADEPTAHLDPVSAQAVRQALAAVRGRVAVLASSHDSALARMLEGPYRTPAHRSASAGACRSDGERSEPVPAGTAVPAADGSAGSPGSGSLRSVLAALPWLTGGLRSGGLLRGVLFAAAAALAAAGLSGVSGWLIVSASHQPPVLHLMVAIVGVRFFGIGRALLRYVERLAVHDAVFRWSTDLRMRVWDALACRPSQWGRLARGGAALGHLVGDIDEVRDAAPRAVVPLPAALLAWAATALAIHWVAPAALPAALAAGALGFLALPLLVLRVERRAGVAAAAQRSWLTERVAGLFAAAPDLAANGAGAEACAASAPRTPALPCRCAVPPAAPARARPPPPSSPAPPPWGRSRWSRPERWRGRWPRLRPCCCLRWPSPSDPWPNPSANCRSSRTGCAGSGTCWGPRTRTPRWPPGTTPRRAAKRWAGCGCVGRRWAGVAGPTSWGRSTRRSCPGAGWPCPGPRAPASPPCWPRCWASCARARGRWNCWRVPTRTETGRSIRGRRGTGRGERRWPPRSPGAPKRRTSSTPPWRPTWAWAGPRRTPPRSGRWRTRSGPWAWVPGSGRSRRAWPRGSAREGHKLSGGQRQRVAVARALVARARVVLLDEPTAHLGEDEAVDLVEDLRAALADRAVVLVTHDERLAERADAVLHLSGQAAAALVS